jgi:hypothetical protein
MFGLHGFSHATHFQPRAATTRRTAQSIGALRCAMMEDLAWPGEGGTDNDASVLLRGFLPPATAVRFALATAAGPGAAMLLGSVLLLRLRVSARTQAVLQVRPAWRCAALCCASRAPHLTAWRASRGTNNPTAPVSGHHPGGGGDGALPVAR